MSPNVTSITHQTRAGDLPVLGNIQAEELIKITGTGFASNARVRADELTMSPILTRHGSSTDTEIRVFLPSVQAMETSSSYKRNATVTNLTISVENPGGSGPTKTSDPWVIPILLGRPRINAPAVLTDKNVSFATTLAGAAPTEVDDLGGHGGPGVDDGLGQIWFYPRVPPLPQLTPPTMLPGGHDSITLPSALVSKLAPIRKSGTRLRVAPGKWNDDSLTAELPEKPIDGWIIVWRDDIPSRPVHVVSLLPLGVTCDQVRNTLAKMYNLNPNSGVPLDPGQTLFLSASPLPTAGLPPLIVNLLSTLTVQFAFRITGLAPNNPNNPKDPNNAYTASPNVDVTNPQPSSLPTGMLLVRPDLFPKERVPQPTPKAFTVQLLLSVSFADCGTIQVAAGVPLQYLKAPLGIPTIAVFFEDDYFNGSPMIVLPPDTNPNPLIPPGLKIDDNKKDSLSVARSAIAAELSSLATILDLLSFFATAASIPGAEGINLLSQLVDKVNAAGHLVIDSEGKMDRLEDAVVDDHWWWMNEDFDDAASSLIMVGSAGFGDLKGYYINGYADEVQSNLRATWSLPSDTIIAALPHFGDMSMSYTINGKIIAQPYGGSTSPADDFNDDMSSLQVFDK